MSTNNRLKVCTFNAKCDDLDYKCCIKDSCYENRCELPDSLVAAMLSVTILPSKADIINIQNVKCEKVVQFLLKEISRVKNITDRVNDFIGSDIENRDDLMGEIDDAVCELNRMTGLCPDAVKLRDLLLKCNKVYLDYILPEDCDDESDDWRQGDQQRHHHSKNIIAQIVKYTGVSEYDAYMNGSCVTLIKKCLKICPVVKEIPCVDSLVLFFEYCERKFINANVNMNGHCKPCFDLCDDSKKAMVCATIAFLKQYEDCGSVIMSGAMGDLDYDTAQLLYRGDALIPELIQQLTSLGTTLYPTPADFPANIEDPVYELLEYLLKTGNGEQIPYSWLLQYNRLKCCGPCKPKCAPKHVAKCAPKKEACLLKNLDDCIKCPDTPCTVIGACKDKKCGEKVCVVKNLDDCIKCPPTGEFVVPGNRQQHRLKKSDKPHRSETHHKKGSDKCETKIVSDDKCKICYKKCGDTCGKICEVSCKPKCDSNCGKDLKYLVKVDVCDDLCEDACCHSCSKGGKCSDKCDKRDNVCAEEKCETEMCDPVTVLKKSLCLYNVLNSVEDVNNRYTAFCNHFNKCEDCKYPKGSIQAQAMCREYDAPKPSRCIDNNSELVAVDHILVSDCLKANIQCAKLSDLYINGCGNTLNKIPFQLRPVPDDCCPETTSKCNSEAVVPDFSGENVKTFFTHRTFTIDLEFNPKSNVCNVACGETVYGLGLTDLWSALDKWNCGSVDVETFAKYGLDKHPYFVDYFYNAITNPFPAATDAKKAFGKVFETCPQKCEVLAYIQKKSSICQAEFFDHLLCVLSHSDSRDRYVTIIGFMIAVIRFRNDLENKSFTNCCDNCPVDNDNACDYLNHFTEHVTPLFMVLDKCFNNCVELAEFFSNFNRFFSVYANCIGISDLPELDTCGLSDTDFLQNLYVKMKSFLGCLSSYINENSSVMAILLRYAVNNGLDLSGDCRLDKFDFELASCDDMDTLKACFPADCFRSAERGVDCLIFDTKKLLVRGSRDVKCDFGKLLDKYIKPCCMLTVLLALGNSRSCKCT